jgi:sensor histidine kinase YesM
VIVLSVNYLLLQFIPFFTKNPGILIFLRAVTELNMIRFLKFLPAESIKEERLKGAMISIYFRWAFIIMLTVTVSAQLISGYKDESIHSIKLIAIYLIANIGLWIAARKKYDPPLLGYTSAMLDVGIISFHLFYMARQFDVIAPATAATTFLYPIIFLLYTFRLNRPLLLFTVLLSVAAFNVNYFLQYPSNTEIFESSLSLSPLSHIFKSTYILFIGLLCIYLQFSMSKFIEKQIQQANEKASLDARVKIEEQKSRYAQELVDQEKRLNKTLEQQVEERTRELTNANTQLLKLQKENLQSQFEVLKQQVNPHFLFNSLNVLSSLIKIDPDLAESFTENLSKVYRYVLENKEKDLVALKTELDFIRAYLFLIDIRFMHKIEVMINIDEKYHSYLILPVAMQLVIENAIKHNTFSKNEPLKIEIFVDNENTLNIINNLKERESKLASTGVGVQNIIKRFELVSDRIPEFFKTETHFIARMPLLPTPSP